jgi:hypothetical protein
MQDMYSVTLRDLHILYFYPKRRYCDHLVKTRTLILLWPLATRLLQSTFSSDETKETGVVRRLCNARIIWKYHDPPTCMGLRAPWMLIAQYTDALFKCQQHWCMAIIYFFLLFFLY